MNDEIAKTDKQNTTEMDLDEVYSTTRNAFNKENIFFQKNWKTYSSWYNFSKVDQF